MAANLENPPTPFLQRGKKKFLDKSSIIKKQETMRFVY